MHTQVPKASGDYVIFDAGATRCGHWQAALYILAALLVITALLPLLLAACEKKDPSQTWFGRLSQTLVHKSTVLYALRHCVAVNFVPKRWWWFALLTIQRVLMVTVQNLGQDKILKSVMQVCSIVFNSCKGGFSTHDPFLSLAGIHRDCCFVCTNPGPAIQKRRCQYSANIILFHSNHHRTGVHTNPDTISSICGSKFFIRVS